MGYTHLGYNRQTESQECLLFNRKLQIITPKAFPKGASFHVTHSETMFFFLLKWDSTKEFFAPLVNLTNIYLFCHEPLMLGGLFKSNTEQIFQYNICSSSLIW